MAFNAPYNQHIFMGAFANDAAALAGIRAQKWDSSKDGLGNPEISMLYYNTTVNGWYYFNETSWIRIAEGILWQDSVLSKTNIPPGAPTAGDRYLVDGAPIGTWVGHTYNIAVWDGASWDYTVPAEGMALWVEDVDLAYRYNGVTWVLLPSSANHNDLLNIQGGAAADYYHLTNAQHTDLTDGGVATVHTHTMDQVYDGAGGGGGATVTVDAADVLFNLSGAFSVKTDASAAAVGDGLQVVNGTDNFYLNSGGANLIDLSAALSVFSVIADSAATFALSANDGAAHAFNISCTNAGAGPAQMSLSSKTAMTIDSTTANISLDSITSSNFTITGNSAGAETLTLSATNAGAGTGRVAISCDGAFNMTSGLGSTIALTANDGGDQYLIINSTNAGGGDGLLEIYADGGITMYSITAGLDIDVETSSHFTIGANAAGNQTLLISATNAGAGDGLVTVRSDGAMTVQSTGAGVAIDGVVSSHFTITTVAAGDQDLLISATNAGAGAADVSLTAKSDVNFTARSNSLTFNDVSNTSLNTDVYAATSIVGAFNEIGLASGKQVTATLTASTAGIIVDYIDNVDEGGGIFKGGVIEYLFFTQGGTAATSDEVYGGVARIKFHGTDAALTRLTVEWVVDGDTNITFTANIAGDQIRLIADNAVAHDIQFYGIRRNYVTSTSHV